MTWCSACIVKRCLKLFRKVLPPFCRNKRKERRWLVWTQFIEMIQRRRRMKPHLCVPGIGLNSTTIWIVNSPTQTNDQRRYSNNRELSIDFSKISSSNETKSIENQRTAIGVIQGPRKSTNWARTRDFSAFLWFFDSISSRKSIGQLRFLIGTVFDNFANFFSHHFREFCVR